MLVYRTPGTVICHVTGLEILVEVLNHLKTVFSSVLTFICGFDDRERVVLMGVCPLLPHWA